MFASRLTIWLGAGGLGALLLVQSLERDQPRNVAPAGDRLLADHDDPVSGAQSG